MLASTLLLLNGEVFAAEDFILETLSVCSLSLDAPRGLLVTLVSEEDAEFHLVHRAMVAYALQIDASGLPSAVDLLHPLGELTLLEQKALREAVTRQSWPAWGRAPRHIRALLGYPDPPLLLADGARQLGIPLATLANAAVQDRVPTIRAGDRHLVYLQTVIEAQDRKLLHAQRGRPRSSRRA